MRRVFVQGVWVRLHLEAISHQPSEDTHRRVTLLCYKLELRLHNLFVKI